jgi:hypothetical protein
VVNAAAVEVFDGYYFDGNKHWTMPKIIQWWESSEHRLNYIISLYAQLSDIAENYGYWLDFYQHGMQEYLEWYLLKLHGKRVSLAGLRYDWSEKLALDARYRSSPGYKGGE